MATKDKRTWGKWRWANYYFYQEMLYSYPGDLKKIKLLDLGGGDGQFQEIFEKFDLTVADFEITSDSPRYKRDENYVTVIADITKTLPFDDNTFDVVILSNVVEHIPDTIALFKECNRVLKRGGSIIGTVPFLMEGHMEPYDYNRPTRFQLDRSLSEAAFSKIDVRPLGNLSDVYYTMTLYFYDFLLKEKRTFVTRLLRKLQHYIVRAAISQAIGIPAHPKLTEGFGFRAEK